MVKKGLTILSESYRIDPDIDVEQVRTRDFIEAGRTVSSDSENH